MLLHALLVLLQLSSFYVRAGASGAPCSCASVNIPVHVDVLVPTDQGDVFGGLKSNSSSLRRVDNTYDIYGVFCQPNTLPAQNSDVLQLLVHGFSYTGQYWSSPIEEFRNYSYTAFSCDRGLSSLAIDSLAAGLSSRPANASDVQFPTSAAVLSELGHHLKTASILPGIKPFSKIIGIGHSIGSYLLNFGAIVDGAQSPFDSLILTGQVIFSPDDPLPSSSPTPVPARDADPIRWGALDPAYVTVNNRRVFYPADPTMFSPRMLMFDAFTKDVGSASLLPQVFSSSVPAANYTGAVAKVLGSEDQIMCAASRCVDVGALTAAERVVWPSAKSFELVVSQGSGHDLNLDFLAGQAFGIIFSLVDKFSG
ncbi:hypothetical protein MVEN_00321000 [Mycena venus]|uniref:AB hydrolase-1 domain-containing protein n=1 Tax=Mycena venus TaxID=2733690 RepID=A0A8H6YUF6_9AGAR|nr:hypothetical protein MVEN_00321000 [Mycena venus]